MSIQILTTQSKLIADVLKRDFQPKSVSVVDYRVIQDRTILKFAQNCEQYTLAKTPERFYNGVPDVHILYQLANWLFEFWMPHYTEGKVEGYVAGSIAKSIEAKGYELSQAVKTFSLIKSKAAINNTVDVISSLSIDPMMLTRTIPNINQDFVHTMLTDPATRMTVLSRLKAVAIPAPSLLTADDIANMSAMIAMGRGEVIPSDYYQSHLALRSLVLVLLRTMVEESINRPELFYDILPAYSLFILYVNITENEQVYDTAFPAISVAGANNVFHQKIISSIKMMAVMFTKIGFVGKAFNGVLATRLLNEFFNIFDDLTDITIWTEPRVDNAGVPIIDFTQKSFAEQNTLKFQAAQKVFDEVLPSMFKGYVEDVITEFKSATKVDVLLSSIADQITVADHSNKLVPAFPNLSADAGKLLIELLDPEGADALPAHQVVEVPVRTFEEFVLRYIFPTTEAIYQLSNQVQQAYDRMLQSLGTPTGSLIPGVNVELETMDIPVENGIPSLDSFNDVPYARIDTVYSFPFYISPLAVKTGINEQGEKTFTRQQIWTLAHLKFRFFRPYSFFMNYAKSGEIPSLIDAPNSPAITLNKQGKGSAFDKWSWPKNSLPVPTYMHDIGFAYTLIPFNYSFDTVFDSFSNEAVKIETVMTRTGRIPGLGYLTYGQVLNSFMMNGAVDHRDLALAVAGMGFVYTLKQRSQNGKGASVLEWSFVSPACPTIYGMPTVMMHEANKVNLAQIFDIGDYLTLKDPTSKEARRVIYDNKLRRPSVGTSVLVLHDKVPTPQRLTYMMTNLRNGFSVNVPYIKSIYNELLKAALFALDVNRQNTDKLAIGGGNPGHTTYIDLQRFMSETLTIFNISPETGEGQKDKSSGAKAFYDAFIATGSGKDMTMANWMTANFEDVLGWSNIIAPYPHLTLRDRYDSLFNVHLNQVYRPLTSKIYVDTTTLRHRETVRIMALTPNEIESMDASDEWNFLDKDMLHLSEVSIGIDRKTLSGKPLENVTVQGEVQVPGGVAVKQSKAEGTDLGIVDGNPISIHETLESQTIHNTPQIIKMDKRTSESETTLSHTGEHTVDIGDKKTVKVKTQQNEPALIKTVDAESMNKTPELNDQFGKGVDLDKPAKKNKEDVVGEGGMTGSEDAEELAKKKKMKGKKFTEDNSEDETDV